MWNCLHVHRTLNQCCHIYFMNKRISYTILNKATAEAAFRAVVFIFGNYFTFHFDHDSCQNLFRTTYILWTASFWLVFSFVADILIIHKIWPIHIWRGQEIVVINQKVEEEEEEQSVNGWMMAKKDAYNGYYVPVSVIQQQMSISIKSITIHDYLYLNLITIIF